MSPAPRGPLRIEAWMEAARAPAKTAQPAASSTLKGCTSHAALFFSFLFFFFFYFKAELRLTASSPSSFFF